jgi:hypothetical protein
MFRYVSRVRREKSGIVADCGSTGNWILLLKSNSTKEVGRGGIGSWMMLLLINKVER